MPEWQIMDYLPAFIRSVIAGGIISAKSTLGFISTSYPHIEWAKVRPEGLGDERGDVSLS